MDTRDKRVLGKVAADDPDVAERMRLILAENPRLPLGEAWIRARRWIIEAKRLAMRRKIDQEQ